MEVESEGAVEEAFDREPTHRSHSVVDRSKDTYPSFRFNLIVILNHNCVDKWQFLYQTFRSSDGKLKRVDFVLAWDTNEPEVSNISH